MNYEDFNFFTFLNSGAFQFDVSTPDKATPFFQNKTIINKINKHINN